MTHGIWHQLDATQLASLALLDAALLAAVLLTTTGISRVLGFNRADEIISFTSVSVITSVSARASTSATTSGAADFAARA